MSACQWERRLVVIKFRVQPRLRRVARDAICWKSRLYVVRSRRRVEVLQVASDTRCWRAHKFPADVAGRASHRNVCARQRERCLRMVEGSAGPIRCAVANRTISREPCLDVVGICGAVIQGDVAGTATGGGAREDIVHMALSTLNAAVGAG